MYYLIYLSTGNNWFNETQLQDILATSQINNRRDNITGMLLYGDGNFIQLLEGEEAMVQQTFNRISNDERHKSITHIAGGILAERNFPEWAMGFKAIDALNVTKFKGSVLMDDRHVIANQNNHPAVNLLNAFIKSARM
jgi:hypothetical protein